MITAARQRGRFLPVALIALLLIAAAAAWVWFHLPEHLPAEWRRHNPHSRDYTPTLYKWRDDHGVLQITDTPPPDRPYEEVRIDPDTNIVPNAPPQDRGDD